MGPNFITMAYFIRERQHFTRIPRFEFASGACFSRSRNSRELLGRKTLEYFINSLLMARNFIDITRTSVLFVYKKYSDCRRKNEFHFFSFCTYSRRLYSFILPVFLSRNSRLSFFHRRKVEKFFFKTYFVGAISSHSDPYRLFR